MLSDSALHDPEALFHHARGELRRRLLQGEDCQAEQLLQAFPYLAADAERAFSLVVAEWLIRRELGQESAPQHWYSRFPQWQQRLKEVFDHVDRIGESDWGEQSTVVEQQRTQEPTHLDQPVGPPQALDHYQLREPIGQGGMGVVFRAWDPVLRRHVALKMIRTGMLAGDEEVERFYREARAAAQLSHPHIVSIYGMGLHQGQHCYVMALVSGGNLAQNLTRFRGQPRESVALVKQIAGAVHLAHSKGIVHRDLKPGNIFLNEQGEPLVGDFGLAKLLTMDVELTQQGIPVGTPAYMAPEQFAGKPKQVKEQSDIWALGVILFELLTGQKPFGAREWETLSQQIRFNQPPRLRSLAPYLDVGLQTILDKCLEKEANRRYDTARALAEDLDHWLNGIPPSTQPAWPILQWRRLLKQPLSGLILVLGLVALGMVAAAGLTSPENQSAEPPALPLKKKSKEEVLIGQGIARPKVQFILGQQEATLAHSPETGALTLRTPKLALVELRPTVPWPAYRLEAEVRHDDSEKGTVGIYCARQRYQTAWGPQHLFLRLALSDKTWVHGGKAELIMTSCSEARGKVTHVHSASRPIYFRPAPIAGGGTPPWRTLVIEVRPKELSGSWEGKELTRKPRSKMVEAASILVSRIGDFSWDYATPAGVGIYVDEGAASFRRVVLKPLE